MASCAQSAQWTRPAAGPGTRPCSGPCGHNMFSEPTCTTILEEIEIGNVKHFLLITENSQIWINTSEKVQRSKTY